MSLLAVVLLHVALTPDLPHDCGYSTHHHEHDSGHACCHVSCCHAAEPVADHVDNRSFTPVSITACFAERISGRDVILDIFRPPRPLTLPA